MTITLDSNAAGLNLKKMLMPDELGQSHADLEAQCSQCHTNFNKSAQSSLCLECHEKIQSDIVNSEGFHGQTARTKNNNLNCSQCHSDHRGRKASLTQTVHALFDHDLSRFPLKGIHQTTNCNACHKPNELKRKAGSTCVDCHSNDDTHKGNLGDDCKSCHSPQGWSEHQFDHDETEFSLRYKHKNLHCVACHVDQGYEKTPPTCHQCHTLDDVHTGAHGTKCQTCHKESKWQDTSFNHKRETDFTLSGAHENLSCTNCHFNDSFEQVAGNECNDCHRSDDIHLGQRGVTCASCHSEKKWSESIFNHNNKTNFPLHAKHATLSCNSCHQSGFEKNILSGECVDCHQSQDIHQGKQGEDCARCHNEKNWSNQVLFDHDLTAFPLIGLHAITGCEQCHITRPFKSIDKKCADCHASDDVHDRSLTDNCQQCHTPNGWAIWLFDHRTQTDFPLDGKHQGLACNACHKKPARHEIHVSQQCINCHSDDDVHEGEFGKFCGRCHSNETFKTLKTIHSVTKH